MVYIHGGGYYSGTSNFYGPDFLINNDVIVVNYSQLSRARTRTKSSLSKPQFFLNYIGDNKLSTRTIWFSFAWHI